MTEETIAIVTGGNRGIGREVCRQLGERGLHVVLAARDERKAREAADELRARGLHVTFGVLDVTDDASVARFAEAMKRATSSGAKIGALINNAAIAMKGFDANVARQTVVTNFYGPIRVTEAIAPVLRTGAHVVNVSSGMGDLSVLGNALRPRFAERMPLTEVVALMERFVREVEDGTHEREGWPSSAYSVSKVGLNALTRAMANELAPQGVRVNSVCPGWVRTDMGGEHAPRSVEEGADTIVWAATGGAGERTGMLFRDRCEAVW